MSIFPLSPSNAGLTRTSEVALERQVEGDLFLQDIGQGFGFRPGSFDGAIRCESSPYPFPLATALTYLPIPQHLRPAVASQRRDITPHFLAAPPAQPFLHDAPFRAAQPRACGPAILPDL